KDPLRIVIDLKNTKAPAKQAYIKAGGALVKRVRYARYTEGTSRVVLEMNEGYEYSAEAGDNGITVYVSKRQAQETLDKAKSISFGKNYGIKLKTIDSRDAVSVSLKNHEGYRITRYTGPDRLVLTIPDAGVFGSGRLVNVDTRQVASISYRKTGKAGAIITFELNGQFQYEADESGDQLVLTFHWPNYTNIYYNNNKDRVYLTLSDTKLTEGAKYLKPLYTEEYDETASLYTITFPTALSVIKEGRLDINDAYLKNFEVRLNPEAGTTSLIFTGNGKNAYLAFTRESGLTTITVMKPAAKGQKLVVIDAGHGGKATGTIYRATEEKDLNLDMAKRLDSLLAKKGIRTYMLRSEDCDVDNFERVYIANKLDASLYLSIHVNAMDDRSYSGTMSLYCPSYNSGFTGRNFAAIIQKNLLSALRTRDRGVISRPDLIVLRETAMPSALAEIAFLSNKTDRANLLKPSFRQKAAQALYDSVVQALPKL
ncbi:MAG TPA: N-acetylmuramoyl-L-alanine amidase, partial [Clostridia bacterium]|nr:N-acetylmuramoyl-L-alanine amidase [Clostridia bacterium]